MMWRYEFLTALAVILLPGVLYAQSKVPSPDPHDPEIADAIQLQDPRTATNFFPIDREQRPDWVDVLRRGLIQPRETLRGGARPPEPMGEAPKSGIVFRNTYVMPYVVFPHQPHSEWLACTNCHDTLFERKATGRGLGMQAILDGKHCGACHGRVAFSPEGSCYRCHSQPNPNGLQVPPGATTPPLERVSPPPVETEAAPSTRRGGVPRQLKPPLYPSRVPQ